MDDFSTIVSGLSYAANSTWLEILAEDMFTTVLVINLPLGIFKTELMYWCIPKQRGSKATPFVTIRDNTFHTKDKIR